nr:glycosyltransferase family 9 protein [Arthrobacter roseus]
MPEQRTTATFGGSELIARGVGPVLQKFDGVRTIAVLRGGGLGDLMFAMPAIDALAAAYPQADITLLGAPAHRVLLEGRPGSVLKVEVLPFAQGVREGTSGNTDDDAAELDRFFDRLGGTFDLAVQLHGGGRYSNPFLLKLKAPHTVGTRTPDAEPLDRTLPYIYSQHEVFRFLEVAGLAGAYPTTLEPQIEVTDQEHDGGQRWLTGGNELLVIHPGATDPRRRWPTSSFAAIGHRAAEDGCRVLVVGDESDVGAAADIVRLANHTAVSSVAGELSLSELVGLLSAATVMVGNDSGPRHLAQAVGTPTVGIYWVGNVINAGAIGRMLHRVRMAWVTHCPVCGRDVTQVGWTSERCEHDDSLVAAIQPDDVYADVRELMATSLLLRGR